MKGPRILVIQLFIACGVMGFSSLVLAQDALNQLNSTTPDKSNTGINDNVSVENRGYLQRVNEDKLKATMTPEEYKNFQRADAYVALNGNYTLGPDDVISIIVMRHPEVSGEYTINKEGKIQYEFAGDVELAGLTKEKAVDLLSKKLSTYIIKPDISLKIVGYNSKIVYVVGEVANPGRIPMHGDTITVREALLAAGLPVIGSAATDSASIFTPSSSGHVTRKKVNVEALLYKGDLREDYILHPGDCLYVPATFLTKAMRAISPVTTPVNQLAGAGGSAKYAF